MASASALRSGEQQPTPWEGAPAALNAVARPGLAGMAIVLGRTGRRTKPGTLPSCGSATPPNHTFPVQIGTWMFTQQLTISALIDAFIFLALAMVLTRTGSLALRSKALRGAPPAPLSAVSGKLPGSSADGGQRVA
jgi:hypothetical protein